MFIPKQVFEELKRKFPFVHTANYFDEKEKITISYLGKGDEKIRAEISDFIKDKTTSSMQIKVVFIKKKMISPSFGT